MNANTLRFEKGPILILFLYFHRKAHIHIFIQENFNHQKEI